MKNYQPVIIVGAPRSGTNMLRDVLCKIPDVGTWPCDEINYIWRHGNIRTDTDAFPTSYARPDVIRYIRFCFDKLAGKNKLDFLVEKTCANSLRVPFVDEVFPDAKYVFIYRNGYDVVASANLRWKAKLDFFYLLDKARFVPISDLPFYFFRFCMNRFHRAFSNDGRLAFWGPQLENMQELLATHSLEQVCALQWKRCVDEACHALSQLPENRVVKVQYESFVTNPGEELEQICRELGINAGAQDLKQAVSSVRGSSVGKGIKQLDSILLDSLAPLVEDTMRELGYE